MLTIILLIFIVMAAAYLLGLRKYTIPCLLVVMFAGLVYYAMLLTTGNITTFFSPDPYSNLYPNMWQHALSGDFGIDPQYAFREYFINQAGDPTVYFGFMPALLRGLASIFNSDIYSYNLGNFSMLLAIALALSALFFVLRRLELLRGVVVKYSLGFMAAVIFGSALSYPMVWGRVHSEVIVWAAAWGIIFVAFYALWVFSPAQKRRIWHGIVLGGALGMAILCRPTVAVTAALPFAALIVGVLWQYVRQRELTGIKLLWPGVACAVILAGGALYVNYQRWGSPLTFVQMDRHVELLKENPQRGADLRKAGEFNANRLPTSLAYYLLPTSDNFTRQWPFIEIDQQLTVMNHAPQYDYIEGSRVPIVLSMTFLVVVAILGAWQVRRLEGQERWMAVMVMAGGGVTLLFLCMVYAVALRYSVDLVPLLVFMGLVYLVALHRKKARIPRAWAIGWHFLLAASVGITLLTTLQYKIISGQIGLSEDVRTNISRKINFPPQEGAKIFIINGVPSPAPLYKK